MYKSRDDQEPIGSSEQSISPDFFDYQKQTLDRFNMLADMAGLNEADRLKAFTYILQADLHTVKRFKQSTELMIQEGLESNERPASERTAFGSKIMMVLKLEESRREVPVQPLASDFDEPRTTKELIPVGWWRDRAACRHADPELFFPGSRDTRGVEAAKKVCATCTVVEECLKYALSIEQHDTNMRTGIWGGKTEAERRAIDRAKTRTQKKLI